MNIQKEFEIEQQKLNELLEKYNFDLLNKEVLKHSQIVDVLHNKLQLQNK